MVIRTYSIQFEFTSESEQESEELALKALAAVADTPNLNGAILLKQMSNDSSNVKGVTSDH